MALIRFTRNIVFSVSLLHLVSATNEFFCLEGTYPPTNAQKAGWFNVDLDKPPEERWVEIIKDYEQPIVRFEIA